LEKNYEIFSRNQAKSIWILHQEVQPIAPYSGSYGFDHHCRDSGGDSMTAIEASKLSGLGIHRIWQFCRKRKINPQNISQNDFNVLMILKRNRVGKND